MARANPNWQQEWDRVLAAAKREGKVVVQGPPGDIYRNALAAINKTYPEITVEYIGGSGRDAGARIIAERAGGQYLVDAYVGGGDTGQLLADQGVWEPFTNALIRPEIMDDSKWFGGFAGGFTDREKKYSYGFEGYLRYTVFVNRDLVPESELSNFQQLLDPKWQGKISANDPRLAGNGSATAAHLLMELGEDYVRKLLAQVAVTTDLRQQLDWLVRGTYPIAVGPDDPSLTRYHSEGLGLNVKPLDKASAAGSRFQVGFGTAHFANRAPNPNAARVFFDWLLSPVGQKSWWDVTLRTSRRLDVPGDPDVTPDPRKTYRSVNYYDYLHYIAQVTQIAQQVIR